MNYFIHKTHYFKQSLLVSVLLLLVGSLKAQCDYSDDFITLPAPASTAFGLPVLNQTTTAGWICANMLTIKGPDAGVKASTVRTKYKAMITGEQGVSLDGYAGSLGSITSPVLSNGFDSISFNYASRSKNEQRILEFCIEKEGVEVWKDTLDQVVTTSNTRYTYGIGKIGVTGACTLKITNITNHPTTPMQGDYGYDVIIWNICIQAPVTEVATPTFTINGREKSNKVYWESVKVGIATTTRDTKTYYTIDGTDPDSTSTLYTDSISLTSSARVKAIAVYYTLQSAIADTLITIAGSQTAALPFNESFATNLGDWYSFNTAGAQEWTTGSEGDTTFTQMSGAPDEYTVVANEDWLISPAFTPNPGNSLVFGFSSAKKYDGNPIALKYSTDYSGVGDPSTATWIDVTDKATLPATEQTWTSSGDIIVSETQPIRVAFVYTSTSDEAALWQIAGIYAENKDVTAPSVPEGLTGTPTETTLDLLWRPSTDNVGIKTYNVYVGKELKGSTADTVYTLTGLSAGTRYSISVEAVDTAGNASEKAILSESTLITGLSSAINNKLIVYPNPFVDYLIIEAATENNAIIYNVSGKTALRIVVNAGRNQINTSELERGVYFLKNGSNIVKIIK